MDTTPLRVGIVGAAGRGASFRAGLEANGASVVAVCDVRADKLDQAMVALGASEKYTSYEQMLDTGHLDAVAIGTPMQFHADQSIAALERNIHVLCEVTAGVSIDECRQLAAAAERSKAIYMMAENYVYTREVVLVRNLCRLGLFGTPYYAEGEYLHELKGLNEITTWRRKWQTGIEGCTYGTHSLGPILQWFGQGERVLRICCEGTGHHYKDPRGEPYHQDSCLMLCKMTGGGLAKVRVDMLSDRPHAMNCHQLQGTDGCYESSRGPAERGRIWLRCLGDKMVWHSVDSLFDIDELARRFVPDDWRNPPAEALKAGHGGGDYFEVRDFIRAIRGLAPCPIGIHEALDMTLPGLVSQQSILQGGAWLDVPDSRQW